jgi:hypothetical protein
MFTKEESELIFTIANKALLDIKEFDFSGELELEIETGCICFDTASCAQKAILIVNSLNALYEKSDFLLTDVAEAGLAYLLEILATYTEDECMETLALEKEDRDNEISIEYRILIYRAWKSIFVADGQNCDLEMIIALDEQIFFKNNCERNDFEFWEDILEIFYQRLGIDDRDYQIASKNPRMFDGQSSVNYILGLSQEYFQIKIPKHSVEEASKACKLFHAIVKKYANNDRLTLLTAQNFLD